ncbi:Hypothetical protein SMAX5B_016296 [Scophthalmus maximus]|uniref:Uncharacterized protein n=1 Tax=Scophthalmus maximus TaxID=52904 RepID=A0A2U9BLL8_SCOMX|nr:Hypothetical protein SMAX5B_016296 [Scophthalmus maximus]
MACHHEGFLQFWKFNANATYSGPLSATVSKRFLSELQWNRNGAQPVVANMATYTEVGSP